MPIFSPWEHSTLNSVVEKYLGANNFLSLSVEKINFIQKAQLQTSKGVHVNQCGPIFFSILRTLCALWRIPTANCPQLLTSFGRQPKLGLPSALLSPNANLKIVIIYYYYGSIKKNDFIFSIVHYKHIVYLRMRTLVNSCFN